MRDLQPVLLARLAWGDKYTAVCSEPIDTRNVHGRPGTGADEEQRRPDGRRSPEWLAR